MPTYVTLAKWTDEGIRNIKDSPKRRQAFEDRITSMGGKVKDAYLTAGGVRPRGRDRGPERRDGSENGSRHRHAGERTDHDNASIQPGGDGQDRRKPTVGREFLGRPTCVL